MLNRMEAFFVVALAAVMFGFAALVFFALRRFAVATETGEDA